MALREIVKFPDVRLKKVADPIEEITDAHRELAADMCEVMYDEPGIGLAAPQVGVTKRVIVVDISPKDGPREPMRMANPEIVWQAEERVIYEEGCLSLPEQYADVERPAKVRVRYIDEENVPCEVEVDGLLATCIQHEMDHLDGIIFVVEADHLSPHDALADNRLQVVRPIHEDVVGVSGIEVDRVSRIVDVAKLAESIVTKILRTVNSDNGKTLWHVLHSISVCF